MATKKPAGAREVTTLARNRKARHEYSIDETVEAGVVLAGSEVKSIRDGKVTLVDAFADIQNGEAWLHQMDVGIYAFAHARNHEPRRRGQSRGGHGHAGQLARAAGPAHGDDVAQALAEQGAADGGLPGDGAGGSVDLVGAHDAVDVAGPLLVLDGDGGAEEDAIA